MMNKIYSMLGLAMKAGKIAYGTDMCIERIKSREVRLLIIAENLSENSKEKMIKIAETYHISIVVFGEIDVISHSIGKENKGVIAILDDGFAKKILQMVNIVKGANN